MVQLEQKRIAEQLAAQPKVDVGFTVPGDLTRVEDEKRVEIPWPENDANHTRLVPLDLCAINVGERTAHNPRWVVTPPKIPLSFTAVNHEDKREAAGDTVRITAQEPVLNPTERREIPLHLSVTRDTPNELKFVCSIFSEDAVAQTKTLKLRIVRNPAA
jgi:hypothetical protein